MHNSTAERLNRTLLDLARTMLIDSQLSKAAWAEAVNFAAFALNTTFLIEPSNKTPFELITGQRPYIGRVLRFGTRCWFYNIKPNKAKLDKRAIAGAIVGIDDDGLSYRVLELGTQNIHRIRDIRTDKPAPLFDGVNDMPARPEERTDDSSPATVEGEGEPSPSTDTAADDDEATDDFSAARNVDGELGISSENDHGNAPEAEIPPPEPGSSASHSTRKKKKDSREQADQQTEGRWYNLGDRSKIKKPERFEASIAYEPEINLSARSSDPMVDVPQSVNDV